MESKKDWRMVIGFVGLFALLDLFLGIIVNAERLHTPHADLWRDGIVAGLGLLLFLGFCLLNYVLVKWYTLYAPISLLSLYPLGFYFLLRAGWFLLMLQRDFVFSAKGA